VFGPTRTRGLAHWLQHNIAGLAGNISLGMMLGIVPEIAAFFGLPLDVRHVTLSTGQATAAFATLGVAHLWTSATIWVVVGILGIGAFNILISFGLALLVAVRARNVRAPEQGLFIQAVFRRLLRAPLSFILPVGIKQSSGPAPAH
jgi:site-specific recombinase